MHRFAKIYTSQYVSTEELMQGKGTMLLFMCLPKVSIVIIRFLFYEFWGHVQGCTLDGC